MRVKFLAQAVNNGSQARSQVQVYENKSTLPTCTSSNNTKVNTDTQPTGPPATAPATNMTQPVNNIQEVIATYLNEEKEKQKGV